MKCYQVIIIEDDPMVAAIDRQYVEMSQNFRVSATFKHGLDALEYLEQHTADLVILDYYTPAINGSCFVEELHRRGQFLPIIMVTSANDTDIVESLLSRGILDYLVKPFEYERFKQAIDKFSRTKNLFASQGTLTQQSIDQLTYAQTRANGETKQLAKGLNVATLQRIQAFFCAHPSELYSTEDVADQVGLSRITVRRYVNYLLEGQTLTSEIDYQTGGRPSILYRYSGL